MKIYNSKIDPKFKICVMFAKDKDKYIWLQSMLKRAPGLAFVTDDYGNVIFVDGEAMKEYTPDHYKAVEAHEIAHKKLKHSMKASISQEREADYAAILLLQQKGFNKAADILIELFNDRQGIEYESFKNRHGENISSRLGFNKPKKINEAIIQVDVKFISDKLNSKKQSLLNAQNNSDVIEILDNLFNKKYWIMFNKTNTSDANCIITKWAIDRADTTAINKKPYYSVIEVFLGKNFYKKLNKIDTDEKWDNFVKSFQALLKHELIHRQQILKFPTKTRMDTLEKIWQNAAVDDNSEQGVIKYLAASHELMARASQALDEFRIAGYKDDEIKQILRTPMVDTTILSAGDSDVFRTYIYYFDLNSKTFKKFLEYIYFYIEQGK